jgi:hypothetical protein
LIIIETIILRVYHFIFAFVLAPSPFKGEGWGGVNIRFTQHSTPILTFPLKEGRDIYIETFASQALRSEKTDKHY